MYVAASAGQRPEYGYNHHTQHYFIWHAGKGEAGMQRALIGLGFVALTVATAFFAFSPRNTPPLKPSRVPFDRMQILTIARAGDAIVAGGELGYLLRSTDDGKTWRTAQVEPRRFAPVTAIRFIDASHGMAVGHEGQILRTTDGGQSWKELHFDARDGTPLMDIRRLPSGAWLAVGGFARALRSTETARRGRRSKYPARRRRNST